MSSTLSSYADSLSVEGKSRYLDKIAVIGGVNPFVPVPLESTAMIVLP